MRKSFTFNGVKKPWLYLLEGRRKSPFAPINNNLLRVPGMPGAYIQSTETDVLYITQPIGFVVNDDEDALAKIDELAEWLITDEPVELQFDDEPGRTYYAKINGGIDDFDKFINQRRGTLVFLCADPYSYGPEKHAEFQDSGIVENKGTAESDPIFELEVLQPVTFAMVSNGEEYNMIGRPISVEEVAVEPMTTILHDTMQTTVGWTTGINVDSGRVVTGEMQSNGQFFYATSFGTGIEGQYHGPALRKSLSETIQDFRAEALVRFSNKVGEVGRLELHLLDENDNLVGRVGLYDSSPSQALTKFNARAGTSANGQQITDTEADYWQNWTNFFGLIRLQRIGNEWTAYASVINEQTWRYHTQHKRVITTNYGNQEIAQVQLHLMAYTAPWGTYEPVYMRVEELWVRRINNVEGVPYIADVGDIITFDHQENVILINGESRKDLKDFGGNYFKLAKGENTLVVIPENSFNTKLKFRERYR